MVLRDFYKIIMKNIVLTVYIVLCLSVLNASSLQVKITNNASVPVAFVIVRTESGSNYRRLYISTESSKLNDDARDSALVNLRRDKDAPIHIVVLAAHGDSVTVTNASQNITEYDRVLWVVPLFDKLFEQSLVQLATSVERGSIGDGVRPFEIGSAKTVTITGDGKPLKFQTTGKLAEGARALLKISKSKPALPSTDKAGGFPIDLILQGDSRVTEVIKKKIFNREAAQTETQQSKPQKSARSTSATSKAQAELSANPEGWPTRKDIKVHKSFDQAVKDLGLPPSAIEDLRNYKDLIEKRQKILDYIQTKVQTNQTQVKRDAWKAIKKYTDYHDQIPY